MYIFKSLPNGTYNRTEVTFEVDEVKLSTLVENFSRFLIACGFVVNKAEVVEAIEEHMQEYQDAVSTDEIL
jgi:hypothetical protein